MILQVNFNMKMLQKYIAYKKKIFKNMAHISLEYVERRVC